MKINKNKVDELYEENLINEIENNNLEKFKEYFQDGGYDINSHVTSKHEYWDTNCFSILGKYISILI